MQEMRYGMWEMGNQKLEMRNGNLEIRILNAHIPFLKWCFEAKNWIGPWEMGNGTETRIPIFKISSSGGGEE